MTDDYIAQLEKEYNITILYACTHGSKAFGWSASYSDEDLRFIYKLNNKDAYLSVDHISDNITISHDNWDVVGWDIRKVLRLALKSNPSLFEWLNASRIFRTSPETEIIKQFILKNLDPNVLYKFHQKAFGRSLPNEPELEINISDYCYLIRSALSLNFMRYYYNVEGLPLDIITSNWSFLTADLHKQIQEVLQAQRISLNKKAKIHRIAQLDDYIESFLSSYSPFPDDFKHSSLEEANKLFRELITN